VLHVFYLRKKLLASTGGHTFDCVKPCHNGICTQRVSSQARNVYTVRFNFQSLINTGRRFHEDATQECWLLQQWKEALTILRGAECVQELDLDQTRFYSTCSNDPIFNEPSSAILSEAVRSYLGSGFVTKSARGGWALRRYLPFQHQDYPATFWVAMCACVLGDLELLEIYASKLASTVDENSFPKSSENPYMGYWPISLLKAAIQHAKSHLVSRLLRQHSSLISDKRTNSTLLQEAIFANDKEVLKALLEYTPNSPDLLSNALNYSAVLLHPSSYGSETIRMLARHFAPLSAESRAWLIMNSCSVGDVTLLEEFLTTRPLVDHRLFDAGSRISSHVHIAISCGNVDSLSFLLDHGIIKSDRGHLMRYAIEQALTYNQIECYRELYLRFDEPRSALYFRYLGFAANSEDIMADFLRQDRTIILETFGDQKDPPPTPAQRALCNSIKRLRPGNVRLLLLEGAHIFPWQDPADCWEPGDPFEIPWPYFNQNRDAFMRTQAVLDAFELPKLKILV
jgi:hypothetical protein